MHATKIARSSLPALLILAAATAPTPTPAQATLARLQAEGRTPLLAVPEVSAVARAAIAAEVRDLNAALADAAAEESTYNPAALAALQAIGKTRVDETYLFEKCVYSPEHLTSLLDDTLSLDDDAAAARRGSLAGMKGLYGARLWKLVARACMSAEERFYERLLQLRSRGVALAMDEMTASQLSRLLFYPTEVGRPSIRRAALSVLGTVLTAAMFIGSTGTLIGLPVGGVILKHVIPVNSLLGLRGAFARSEAALRSADGLLQTSQDVPLDLTAEERRFL